MTQSPGSGAAGAPQSGSRPAFLPNDVDPTVFDEGFLRQLERLLFLLHSPVRGGLKGGRRSVKRGQSVEFADYRDYALGDDLRQLDWNVFARLEKLFVKLFVEEEDVTITVLLDASTSMASGTPEKLLFAKRAAAALGYIGLASEDRVAVFARVGVDGATAVSLQVPGLDRVRHRAERQVRALEGDLGAADPRGAVLAQGGQDVRLSSFEPRPHHSGELAGLALELCPCCHAQQSATRLRRLPATRR